MDDTITEAVSTLTSSASASSSSSSSIPPPSDAYSDKQHSLLTRWTDGLYIPKELVRQAMAPLPNGERRRILDLGTSGGAWAVDIALVRSCLF